jgi:hypothetical protein
MAGWATISIVEPGALHRAWSIGEDSRNDIGAEIAIHLFNHSAMGFHSQPVTQPDNGLTLFITTEMDVSFAIAFMPFQNSPEIL